MLRRKLICKSFLNQDTLFPYTQEMAQGTEMQINFEIEVTYNGTLYVFNRIGIFPDF